jgi:5-methyltetrahydrofolate--homocysteine methyltransferase
MAPALLSRSHLFRFHSLGPDPVERIIRRALTDQERGLGEYAADVTAESIEFLIRWAEGDARRALNTLELAVITTPPGPSGKITVTPEIMAEAIKQVQAVVDVPICIDSSVIPALKKGLEVAWGKPIVNSVTGEESHMEAILPLVAERGAAVIAITNDENGISYDAKERFAVAKKIVDRAASYGIPPEDVIIDPLAMPAGAVAGSAKTMFEIVRMVNEELGSNTTCGASNISFGLPNRKALNAAFVAMAIASGMTSAITNPLEPEIMNAIKAADALMGHDENCAAWIMANRPKPTEGETGARRRPRRRPRSA